MWDVAKYLHFSWLHVPFILASSAKPEPVRRENARKGSVVNVNPTNIRPQSDSPEIRKYKKKFNSEVLCAALWGKLRSTWVCVWREGSSRRGWEYMPGRLHSCIAPLLSESPGVDHWVDNQRHAHDTAFLVEDGKQMTYSCKEFCASEWENILIGHRIETVLVGRAKSCKCSSNLCGSWYLPLS